MHTCVEIDSVSVIFGEQVILSDISFSLEKGKIITLLGPNGAGKSTLAKVVLGLIAPTTGKVWREKNLRMSYVPQKITIEPSLPLSVRRFLLLQNRAAPEKIVEALAEVNAEKLLDKSLHSLSGGEMQRVLLARALFNQPGLLILDEPTQGVDIKGQIKLHNLIDHVREKLNCAVLMISHDLHLVMARTNEVICLNGHICCSGVPEKVSQDPAFVSLFGKIEMQSLALYHHHHDHHHPF